MITKSLQPWILAGYEIFALEGPNALKVEVLSRKVNKSKSSFYHHFADLEVFTEFLLKYHVERAKILAELEGNCKAIDPELINVIVDCKLDLLFNRRLRIDRTNEAFRVCFEKSNYLVAEAVISLWANELGLTNDKGLAKLVFGLALENFYLQITEETLNYEWLSEYFNNIRKMVEGLKRNQ